MCPFNNIARHISTSGTAQTVAKPARLKPIRKCSYSIPGKDYLKFSIYYRNIHLRAQFI